MKNCFLFRSLHSYGHHLFSILHSEPAGPRPKDASEVDPHAKEQVNFLGKLLPSSQVFLQAVLLGKLFLQARHQTATWLTFLSSESVVRGIGLVVASSTNKEVDF